MKNGMVAMICMVITLVFIIVAFIGPWWGGTDDTSGFDVESYMHLTKSESKMGSTEMTIEYSDLPDSDMKSVFNNTYYMVIIAIIFSILALIGMLGLAFNFGPMNTMKMVGLIFGILTFILALVAALYIMVALPDATPGMDGFWMDKTGPAYGWYLMIIAAIIALISSVMILKVKPAGTPPAQ